MIPVLTGTSHSPLHMRGMPRSDTSNFAKTFVRLPRQLLGTPSASDALETVTFRNSNCINHLVLFEDRANLDRLLEESLAKIDLLRDTPTINLNLHQMCFLLLERGLVDLGVGKDANNSTVFPDTFEFTIYWLARVLSVLLGVLGKCLLLRLIPILVKSSLDFIAEMLCPDSGEGAKAARSLDITDKTNNHHLESL